MNEGIHYIKRALGLEAENPDYWYIFGNFKQKLGCYDEAWDAYEEVIEIDPEFSDVWIDFSNLLFDQQKKQEAIEIITEGIEHHPKNAELYYRKTGYLLSMGETHNAYRTFEMALGLNYDKHIQLFDFLPQAKDNSIIIDLIQLHKD